MNRQQLYTLSGVLLASTAITGAANAAIIRIGAATTSGTYSTTTVKIANTIFSTTATTADTYNINTGGGRSFAVLFSNSFTGGTKFSVEINITGAQFNTSNTGAIALLVRDSVNGGLGTYVATFAASGACTSITPLVGKLILDGCQVNSLGATISSGTSGANFNGSAFAGGLVLSGTVFNTANGLATVGNTIALSGSIYNTNNTSQVFETVTQGNIITSLAPLTATVTACQAVVAAPIATPAAFDYLTSSNGTSSAQLATLGLQLTMCLATVAISNTGALSATLTGAVDLTSAASSVAVTLSSTILSSSAVTWLQVAANAAAGTALFTPVTPANFASGVATFSLGSGDLFTSSAFTINIVFSGTTPIPAAAAGTVGLVFGKAAAGTVVAAASVSGTTASITRGGFNSELNTFLASSNTSFTSFARIHNMGATAGTATITVLNDATGAQLGSSFTTATVASGQTLQLSNKDLETGAGITAAAGVNYTIQLTGPFIGYAQHIIFNPATGQLADLSGFRNHDAGSANSP